MNFSPDLLTFNDGTPVKNASDWKNRRDELLEILHREEYGYPPEAPQEVTGKTVRTLTACASGNGVLEIVEISFKAQKGEFTFPIRFFVPKDGKKHPTIVLINFHPNLYKLYPAEEILDNGFALAEVNYRDITNDDADFSDRLAGLYDRPSDGTGFGKLSLWAFGVSRVIDYLQTREEVDTQNIAAAGHSRLGKTVMLCAAQDERVKYALVNCSGCGGAALEQTKHEGAETIASMKKAFPYWFCENRSKYADGIVAMPFDQHFLAAAIAPRYLSIVSATRDVWADPYSEQLCGIAASGAWEILGCKGLVAPTEPAPTDVSYQEGHAAYILREGIHFFGRRDWLNHMEFIKRHLN